MHLPWNEIRDRAAALAREWKDAIYGKDQAQRFYNAFFAVFGARPRKAARFKEHAARLDGLPGFVGLLWPGVLIVERNRAGRDLEADCAQAVGHFGTRPGSERPRYILASDFRILELHDLESREAISFPLSSLPAHVESFGFLRGLQIRTCRDRDPPDIEAARLVGRLHDALAAAGHVRADLERFLVRIVFCMFADDTGVFEPRGIFLDFVESRTDRDGSDLGPWIDHVFQVIETPKEDRSPALDKDLARFPHVEGGLFEGRSRILSFNAEMRLSLLEACRFDWSRISPAIFGALFQSAMDPGERREQGAHYTTERNILKVIDPLFMDDLRSEFERTRALKDQGRIAALRRFRAKIGGLAFLDPACGCGNFLVVAYRELRRLEIEAIREIRNAISAPDQAALDAERLPAVALDQFHGIELGEFPARVAETALWMTAWMMNGRPGLDSDRPSVRSPLGKAPRIVRGDALEIDWSELMPTEGRSFVLGNPPFAGAKRQTAEQRSQVRGIAGLVRNGGTLDYAAAWFLKAGEYAKGGSARIGLVATSSITQGEQAAQLWPLLFGRCGMEISFAHRTFAWSSDQHGKASVHVVVLGLDPRDSARPGKRLFSYPGARGEPVESRHRWISPYLLDAAGLSDPHLVVGRERAPINGMSRMIVGSKPIDGGSYILGPEERAALLDAEPEASPWIRPFAGAQEFLQGEERWILALHDAPPDALARLPAVRKRIAAVRAYREKSRSGPTRRLADTPALYHVNVLPAGPFLAVPRVSSERREYVPMGWLEPPTVPSDALLVRLNATLADFGLLSSAMHMAWLRHIGGRLRSDYRYSIGLVHNTFPAPPGNQELPALEPLARAVLDARAAHPDATLADLYDPRLMPPDLRRAHSALDRGVDRLYRRGRFASERERMEHLFELYESRRNPLSSGTEDRKRRKR